MAICKDCIHTEICKFYRELGINVLCYDCGYYKSTADVVPRSEVEREVEREVKHEVERALQEVKGRIRDAAVYPHNSGIKPYITVKSLEAIMNNYIKEIRRKI